jgi:hypothetical protein
MLGNAILSIAIYLRYDFKALLLFHNDAHNHTSLLCRGAVYRIPAQQAGMLP